MNIPVLVGCRRRLSRSIKLPRRVDLDVARWFVAVYWQSNESAVDEETAR
jgi:hypothetical protein